MNYLENIDFAGNQEPREVMRRVSKVTSECGSLGEYDMGENNIRQEYQHAVECLIQCESLIKDLDEQVSSKDKTIKSLEQTISTRDERITSLEERLIEMSLALASSKALEDEHLLLKRKILSDIGRSGRCEESSSTPPAVNRVEQDAAKVSFETEPKDRPQWHESSTRSTSNSSASKKGSEPSATLKDSRYQPTSNSKRNLAGHPSWSRFASSWGGGDSPHHPIANESFTSGTGNTSNTSSSSTIASPQTSFTSANSTSRKQSWANFGGQLMRRNRPSKNGEDVQVQFPNKEKEQDDQDDTFESRACPPTTQQRRLPNRRRLEMQKSSRSFLEAKGVVFPVSSFEVLNKGCHLSKSIMMKQGQGRTTGAGGSNDDWPEFG